METGDEGGGPAAGDEAVLQRYDRLTDECRVQFEVLHQVPQYGSYWRGFFTAAFDRFTALWKLQRAHRALLMERRQFGRVEIGDMASRIAQIYFHFYLRSANRYYLKQAQEFLEAVRSRRYFDVDPGASARGARELHAKRFRCLARYLAIALLLRSATPFLETLIRNMREVPFANGQQVADEAAAFLQAALGPCAELDELGVWPPVPEAPRSPSLPPHLDLGICLLVSSVRGQRRFSEVNLDLFRMAGSLERRGVHAEGAPKHLLYRPSSNLLLAVLASALANMPVKAACLIYLAAPPAPLEPAETVSHAHSASPTGAERDLGDQMQVNESGSEDEDEDEDELAPDGVLLSVAPSLPATDPEAAHEAMSAVLTFRDVYFALRHPLILIVDSHSACCFDLLVTNVELKTVLVLAAPAFWPPHAQSPAQGSVLAALLTQPTIGLLRLLRGYDFVCQVAPLHTLAQLHADLVALRRLLLQPAVRGFHACLANDFVASYVATITAAVALLRRLQWPARATPTMYPGSLLEQLVAHVAETAELTTAQTTLREFGIVEQEHWLLTASD
ncbi:uncharacterized protein MONBRDRAFT_36448 [Monosiga brevicollis MX1]|uniref:Protein SCAI n=1 Tax=Monosiga brevicollis TaxID=81824 RepID=A9UUK6_MONBE|nr:uncharacterized protein MONBRDRAFT_36448 [Monosiga brevicollis MX1]EDQ90919.1 predicted protein [Monosiga brevicollis MX1]|eukprot:XP_001744216.1 hypothetical protein [Monosiga brevicollis MX1]